MQQELSAAEHAAHTTGSDAGFVKQEISKKRITRRNASDRAIAGSANAHRT
jgi:hypothetical protein